MTINIENEIENGLDFDYEELINKVINQAIDYTEFPFEAEINVVLTDNDAIWEINKEYRNIDRPTDVLSFPMLEYEMEGYFYDIYIEYETLFDPEN